MVECIQHPIEDSTEVLAGHLQEKFKTNDAPPLGEHIRVSVMCTGHTMFNPLHAEIATISIITTEGQS